MRLFATARKSTEKNVFKVEIDLVFLLVPKKRDTLRVSFFKDTRFIKFTKSAFINNLTTIY